MSSPFQFTVNGTLAQGNSEPASLVLAFLGGWEVVLGLAILLILLVAKKLPEIMTGIGNGMFQLRKELDGLAHDAGKSAGGILGKPAAEALTPDNQTAELYDPSVFRRARKRRSLRQILHVFWRKILVWLRINRE